MAKKVQVPTTKSAIMAALAEAAGISKKQAVAAYDKLLEIAYAGAKTPKGIVLPGLGKLIKAKSKARTGRNPKTGEPMKIPARTKVKFRVAKAAKLIARVSRYMRTRALATGFAFFVDAMAFPSFIAQSEIMVYCKT